MKNVTGHRALSENSDRSENHENAKVRKHEIEDLLIGDFRFVFSFFRGFVIVFSSLDKLAGKAHVTP